jgi:hypothetical protein
LPRLSFRRTIRASGSFCRGDIVVIAPKLSHAADHAIIANRQHTRTNGIPSKRSAG